VSDLPQNTSRWLASVFKDQSLNNIVPLNIHEYVHTQQRRTNTLLGMSLREGSCDSSPNLVMGEPMQNNYIQYGWTHEKELKDQFKQEMYTAIPAIGYITEAGPRQLQTLVTLWDMPFANLIIITQLIKESGKRNYRVELFRHQRARQVFRGFKIL
jgi:hypothetical protein